MLTTGGASDWVICLDKQGSGIVEGARSVQEVLILLVA